MPFGPWYLSPDDAHYVRRDTLLFIRARTMHRKMTVPRKPLVWLLVIAVSIGGLLSTDFYGQFHTSLEQFRQRHLQQTRELQDDVDAAAAVIDGLRVAAENHLQHGAGISSQYAEALGPVPNTEGYGLVMLPPPVSATERLNLTGLGPIDSPVLREELGAALELEPIFRWVKGIYPETPWVYYLSAQRFMAVYPFIPFEDFFMDEAFFGMDLYRLGQPDFNPRREHYITPVYEDEAGQGLMVTVGAPVYRANDFAGIVGFDLTIRSLSNVLQQYHQPGDVQYLVQKSGQVIAWAGALENHHGEHQTPPLDSFVSDLQSRLQGQEWTSLFLQHDGRYFHADRLANAPWILLSERSRLQVLGDAGLAVLPHMLFVLVLALGFLMYAHDRRAQERIRTENALRLERDKLKTMVDEQTHDLTEAKEHAESAARAKTNFLANMSHEIRTPLHAVLGFARIGLEESNDRESRVQFQRIVHSGKLLLRVLNDVLDLSRIDEGRLTLVQTPFQIRETIRDALDTVSEQANQKSLVLIKQISPSLPDWVAGDHVRLQQILMNLLSNAVKYTENGQITVDVTWESDHLRLSVGDTGIGITEEKMERMFQPFEQGDNSITREYGGSGLGLAITKSLVELMGGEINVFSEPGRGSEFVVQLPMTVADQPVSEQPQTSASMSAQLKDSRVLVVDDDPINRKLLTYLLSREGAEVSAANNGQEALDRIRKSNSTKFDFILMDIQMPLMSGYEAAGHILDLHPTLPIIGLTAHAFPEDGRKCLDAGMVECLTKPCAPEELLSTIRKHVH